MNIDVTNIVNQLSEKLSAPAQQAWNILLQQQIVFGWMDLIFGLLMIIGMGIITRILLARNKSGKLKYLSGSYYDSDNEMCRVTLWIVNVILGMWGTLLIVYGIMYLTNPSYWAIMSLIGGGQQ